MDPSLNSFLAEANASLAQGQASLASAQNNLNAINGVSSGIQWPWIVGGVLLAGIFILQAKK